ncbi:MAG: DUF2336 domain-containing protein [Roseiarcus sp.]|jgi:uncharacterized protein (DUF2336 family)
MIVSGIEPPAPHQPVASGIVRRFIAWAQRADAAGRAQAASALARAYLYSDLGAALRRETAIGLASLLDDPSTLVRRALAEALAGAAEAPHHIVLALASDQSEVSSIVLALSPVLTDADLVDCVAMGDVRAQIALARRPRLGVSVAAALAEIGEREAVVALVDNLAADLGKRVMVRIFERFGEDAQMREALLARPTLPATLRCDLVAATARALSAFVADRRWLSPERADRITREAADQGALRAGKFCEGEEMPELVRHLRDRGRLTIALLVRALLSGHRELVAHAFCELSGVPRSRIAGFFREPRGAGFAALYAKTGLPVQFLPAFRAALDETGAAQGDHMSWAATERVIAACEKLNAPGLDTLMSLLRRFEAEAAREEARRFASESAAFGRAPPLLLDFDGRSASHGTGAAPPIIVVEDRGALQIAPPPVELPADRIAALAQAA